MRGSVLSNEVRRNGADDDPSCPPVHITDDLIESSGNLRSSQAHPPKVACLS